MTVWCKVAKNVAKYMKKGSFVGVVGRKHIRSYDDSNENKKCVTEVIVEEVQVLKNRKEIV
nr:MULTISPECIES: single-stranded DNA-binding protein [Clostridium]